MEKRNVSKNILENSERQSEFSRINENAISKEGDSAVEDAI